MSPRGKRVTQVDPSPSGEPNGDEFSPEDEDDAIERASMGDLLALADATYADWTWHVYRMRSPEDMARTRSRQQSVWVLTITGPLDIAQLRDTVGGGLFTLWGYIGGKLQHKIRFEMEGPPRFYTPPAPPAPVAAPAPAAPAPAPTPNETDPVLLQLLQSQQKTLEAIAAAVARPQQPAGFSFREMLAFAQSMGGRGGSGVDVKDMVALFRQGIEIGGEAGGGEKSTLDIVLEKGIPVLERIAINLARRPVVARPGAPAQPRPRTPSSAQVIEDPPGVATATAQPPGSSGPVEPELTEEQKAAAIRWGAAVDALARAVESGDDPVDFADTLDALLLPEEIDLMLAGGATAVMEQLRTAADRHPVLAEPRAEQFVEAVLTSLANDPEPAL